MQGAFLFENAPIVRRCCQPLFEQRRLTLVGGTFQNVFDYVVYLRR